MQSHCACWHDGVVGMPCGRHLGGNPPDANEGESQVFPQGISQGISQCSSWCLVICYTMNTEVPEKQSLAMWTMDLYSMLLGSVVLEHALCLMGSEGWPCSHILTYSTLWVMSTPHCCPGISLSDASYSTSSAVLLTLSSMFHIYTLGSCQIYTHCTSLLMQYVCYLVHSKVVLTCCAVRADQFVGHYSSN